MILLVFMNSLLDKYTQGSLSIQQQQNPNVEWPTLPYFIFWAFVKNFLGFFKLVRTLLVGGPNILFQNRLHIFFLRGRSWRREQGQGRQKTRQWCCRGAWAGCRWGLGKPHRIEGGVTGGGEAAAADTGQAAWGGDREVFMARPLAWPHPKSARANCLLLMS